MDNLIVFLISFVIILVIMIIGYFIRRKKGNLESMREVALLVSRFKLKKKDLNLEKLGLVFALINSLIIAITGTVATMNEFKYIWQIGIGFVVILCLTYVAYGIVGKILLRRRDK